MQTFTKLLLKFRVGNCDKKTSVNPPPACQALYKAILPGKMYIMPGNMYSWTAGHHVQHCRGRQVRLEDSAGICYPRTGGRNAGTK